KKEDKPATTHPIVWACIVAPGTFSEYKRLQELAEDSVDNAPRNWLYQCTLGAVMHRAGDQDSALQRLKQALAWKGNDGDPRIWLFMALAYHKLGHADDAKAALDKALRWWQKIGSPSLQEQDNVSAAFTQRLQLAVLRREAETLLGGDANPKK